MTNDDSFSLNDWFFSVVAQTDGYLGQHGFLRSGKTNAFYKINSTRTKGCLIVFRQSVDNTRCDPVSAIMSPRHMLFLAIEGRPL